MPPKQPGRSTRWNARLRRWMLRCAILAATLLGTWLLAVAQINDRLRSEFERALRERYAGLDVSVRGAKLFEGRGIEVHGIAIRRPGEQRPLVRIEEIFTACATDLRSLLTGRRPPPRELRVKGMEVFVQRTAEGQWSVAELWPPPSFGCAAPPIQIRDAGLVISDASGDVERTLAVRNAELRIDPDWASAAASRGGLVAPDPPRQIRGSFASEQLGRVVFTAWMDAVTGDYRSRGRIERLQLSPQLHDSLPAPLAVLFAPARTVAGEANLDFGVSGNVRREGVPAFSVKGTLSGGQIIDPRLPYRLYDLQADIECSERQLQIRNLVARNGASRVRLDLVRHGWQEASPYELNVEARQWDLDRRFVEVLPDRYRALWQEYLPAGVIDADARLVFDGVQSRPEISVHCRDVSFAYHRFPYRLERTQGTVHYDGSTLRLQLVAQAGGQPVSLDGVAQTPDRQPSGWLEVACPSPIPIDEKLLSSIVEPRAQAVFRSLHPGGMFTFTGRFERDGSPGAPLRKNVRMELVHCSLRHERFPYPLGMIRGTVLWNDQGWFFQQLAGQNDSGYVECEGSWRSLADGSGELSLDLIGTDVPLEEELRNALPEHAIRLWNELRPRGTIDRLDVNLRYASQPSVAGSPPVAAVGNVQGLTSSTTPAPAGPGPREEQEDREGVFCTFLNVSQPADAAASREAGLAAGGEVRGVAPGASSGRLSLAVRAEKRKDQADELGRTVTVHPIWLPIRMDDVAGVFTYRDGVLQLDRVSAVHDKTEIQLAGVCRFSAAGSWNVELSQLAADHVQLDRELVAGLPNELGKTLARLNVSGELGLRGTLAMSGDGQRPGPAAAGWDLAIDIENGTLQAGARLEHIYGGMRLAGGLARGRYANRGEVQVDSLFAKGLQLTQVRGPFSIEPDRFMFGAEAERQVAGQPPRSVTAAVAGGQLSLDGSVWFAEDTPFRLQARLEAADLADLSRDLAMKDANVRGKANGALDLQGNRQGWPSWQGNGAVRLYEANIYEIPVMLALLNLLSVRLPDTTAFTSSDIDFRLHGDRVYFERINFHGDAISLNGTGEMDLDRHIDLRFYGLVGRRELELPLVQSLLRHASQQLLLIHVNGTLDAPQFTREPLPALKETLEQFFPEAAIGGGQLSGWPSLAFPALPSAAGGG